MCNARRIDTEYSKYGDVCILSDGKRGICTNYLNCESASELSKAGKDHEILHCGFDGQSPIVCCERSKKFFHDLCKDGAKLTIGNKITEGNKTDVGEFPFQVVLGKRDLDGNPEFNCGGTLIADDIVLTASHCMNSRTKAADMVRIGRTSLVQNVEDHSVGEDIDIDKVILHPEFQPRSRHNDIAILKLKRPANLSNNFIKTVCLATDDKNVPSKLTVTGYGTMNVTTNTRSDWLLKGTVENYAIDDCRTAYRAYTQEVIDRQFCANSRSGVDACGGDSGGPLSFTKDVTYYLYGVISYGIGCGSQFPAIYTKVNQYLEWIQKEMLSLA